MRKTFMTKEGLRRELEEMRRKLRDIEQCRREFLRVQQQYDKLLESAPDAMVFVDREARMVLVNAQLERLFGYSEDELTGKDLHILIPERFRARHREHLKEYFSNPRVRPMGTGLKIYGLKKDGTEFPADISLSPLETDGELLTMGAIRDITERKRAEELIERNYHIQRVISSVLRVSLEPLPLDEQMEHVLNLIFTIPGLALESKGAIYLVEDEPGVLVLKAPRKSSDAKEPPCEKIAFGKCLCGQAAEKCETVFADCVNNSHGISYVEHFPHGHYCVPIASGGETLGLINVFVREGHKRSPGEEEFLTSLAHTLAGVIHRFRTEREKELLQIRLAQAEKFTALGRITANVADEIRNPLTSVGGFARRLHRKIPEGAPEKEYADFIIEEVDRLENILRDVLVLSRGGGPQRKENSINDILEDAIGSFEERSRNESVEVLRSTGDIPLIQIDREQVLEALKNVLSNALDAMRGSGTLSIATERETVRGVPYVTVKIKDTGEGIPAERMKMIFEPFFTTKVQPKGTGLGLPIAKKIVEDHGGFILAESEPGAGSTFRLSFPAMNWQPKSEPLS
jgi:PAS domain S-box-containing protein